MEELFSEAKEMKSDDALSTVGVFWTGNFFPDRMPIGYEKFIVRLHVGVSNAAIEFSPSR